MNTTGGIETVLAAGRPIVEYLDAVEAFYGDEPYDADGDIIDTASGFHADIYPLRWSDLRNLRAALAAAVGGDTE